MILTKNFSFSEFECNDGSETPITLIPNIIELAANLQALRDYFGVSISINSSYRSKDHNKSVGGSLKSQHLAAKASDIVVKGKTPEEVVEVIEMLIQKGEMKQGGLSSYSTFTHYDIRGYKARW